jgi:hypothetical protein
LVLDLKSSKKNTQQVLSCIWPVHSKAHPVDSWICILFSSIPLPNTGLRLFAPLPSQFTHGLSRITCRVLLPLISSLLHTDSSHSIQLVLYCTPTSSLRTRPLQPCTQFTPAHAQFQQLAHSWLISFATTGAFFLCPMYCICHPYSRSYLLIILAVNQPVFVRFVHHLF